jgi:hypothetical protein
VFGQAGEALASDNSLLPALLFSVVLSMHQVCAFYLLVMCRASISTMPKYLNNK